MIKRMTRKIFSSLSVIVFCVGGSVYAQVTLQTSRGSLRFSGLSYETTSGRKPVPLRGAPVITNRPWATRIKAADGKVISVAVTPRKGNFDIRLSAEPSADIVKWGLMIDSRRDEYYTGLMERVVDGPQAASWKPGIKEAMDLRGQKVEMIIKPTTSVYAPFYLSSRGYAILVKGNWPGYFDFAASDPNSVGIEFEGPSFEMKVYTASHPAELVRKHALEVGPPFLPPKWMFTPWRWRDEHRQRPVYYDRTVVTGPFNSEIMENVLLMKAFGIPNGVYWIDRPWGPGLPWGYDDFEIDDRRLPHFAEMVKWLDGNGTKTVLWIAPFFQGEMAKEAHAKGYTLVGQVRPSNGNNYPMVDLTNPAAKAYWQNGVAKLLQLGGRGSLFYFACRVAASPACSLMM